MFLAKCETCEKSQEVIRVEKGLRLPEGWFAVAWQILSMKISYNSKEDMFFCPDCAQRVKKQLEEIIEAKNEV